MANPCYVVGGGLIGLLTARELALAGEQVVVLDRQAVGQEASWAGGGILSPLYPWRYPEAVSDLVLWSQGYYPSLAKSLFDQTQINPEWVQSGMLIITPNDVELAENWCELRRSSTFKVDRQWVLNEVPVAQGALGPHYWLPEVAQVRNPHLLNALRADLAQRGVKLRENVRVDGFNIKQGRLCQLRTNLGDISGGRVVLAAGAWSQGLLEDVGMHLPLQPIKGQMLLARTKPGLLSKILLKDDCYLIPRSDGHILIGSTFENVGFDKTTTQAAQDQLWAAALDIVPALETYGIARHWAGLRPGSPDGVPYIGEHPEIRGLFVCTGHFRNGIVMGPASARLVVDLLLEREPLLDPGPYELLRN